MIIALDDEIDKLI